MAHPPTFLAAYLSRVGLAASLAAAPPSAELLGALMAAQSRAIPFENLDVVLRRPVSLHAGDVAAKLLGAAPRRGGYCFEHNGLLLRALLALGFRGEPLLCRVRWGKAPDEATPFTHVALRVGFAGTPTDYLVDVGFAGTNSVAPLPLGGAAAALPEGTFRALDGATAPGYTTLQLDVRGEWRDLYMWRTGEAASRGDLAQANLWSYAAAEARFTNELFVTRVVDGARHFLINDVHRVRPALDAAAAATTEEVVRDAAHLDRLLSGVFGLDAPGGVAEAWERAYRRR